MIDRNAVLADLIDQLLWEDINQTQEARKKWGDLLFKKDTSLNYSWIRYYLNKGFVFNATFNDPGPDAHSENSAENNLAQYMVLQWSPFTKKQAELFEQLIQHQPQLLKRTNRRDETVLHTATLQGHVQAIEIIAKYLKADPVEIKKIESFKFDCKDPEYMGAAHKIHIDYRNKKKQVTDQPEKGTVTLLARRLFGSGPLSITPFYDGISYAGQVTLSEKDLENPSKQKTALQKIIKPENPFAAQDEDGLTPYYHAISQCVKPVRWDFAKVERYFDKRRAQGKKYLLKEKVNGAYVCVFPEVKWKANPSPSIEAIDEVLDKITAGKTVVMHQIVDMGNNTWQMLTIRYEPSKERDTTLDVTIGFSNLSDRTDTSQIYNDYLDNFKKNLVPLLVKKLAGGKYKALWYCPNEGTNLGQSSQESQVTADFVNQVTGKDSMEILRKKERAPNEKILSTLKSKDVALSDKDKVALKEDYASFLKANPVDFYALLLILEHCPDCHPSVGDEENPITDQEGKNIIEKAVMADNVAVLKKLEDDPFFFMLAGSGGNEDAAMWAVQYQSQQAFEYLAKNSEFNPNYTETKSGDSLLIKAVRAKNQKAVDILLSQKNTKPEHSNKKGETAFAVAFAAKDYETAAKLFEKMGGNKSPKLISVDTPLMMALKRKDRDHVRFYLEQYAKKSMTLTDAETKTMDDCFKASIKDKNHRFLALDLLYWQSNKENSSEKYAKGCLKYFDSLQKKYPVKKHGGFVKLLEQTYIGLYESAYEKPGLDHGNNAVRLYAQMAKLCKAKNARAEYLALSKLEVLDAIADNTALKNAVTQVKQSLFAQALEQSDFKLLQFYLERGITFTTALKDKLQKVIKKEIWNNYKTRKITPALLRILRNKYGIQLNDACIREAGRSLTGWVRNKKDEGGKLKKEIDSFKTDKKKILPQFEKKLRKLWEVKDSQEDLLTLMLRKEKWNAMLVLLGEGVKPDSEKFAKLLDEKLQTSQAQKFTDPAFLEKLMKYPEMRNCLKAKGACFRHHLDKNNYACAELLFKEKVKGWEKYKQTFEKLDELEKKYPEKDYSSVVNQLRKEAKANYLGFYAGSVLQKDFKTADAKLEKIIHFLDQNKNHLLIKSYYQALSEIKSKDPGLYKKLHDRLKYSLESLAKGKTPDQLKQLNPVHSGIIKQAKTADKAGLIPILYIWKLFWNGVHELFPKPNKKVKKPKGDATQASLPKTKTTGRYSFFALNKLDKLEKNLKKTAKKLDLTNIAPGSSL